MSDRVADARSRIVVADVRAASPAGARTPYLEEFRNGDAMIRSAHAPLSGLIRPIVISGNIARM